MFEINLVPDIKEQAIKAIKLRNLIFFICIVVAAASAALLIVLTTIKGGQDIALSNQDARLEKLSVTLKNFDDLDELLTIQTQLKDLAVLNGQKTTLSRIFNVVDTLLPTNGDKITISELNVNLAESTVSFDAQLRAYVEPKINFNALDAFKKSMPMMRYDYGRYVDEEGNEIPTLCIEEKVEKNGQIKAIWARGAKGCDPANNENEDTADNGEAQEIFEEAEAEPDVPEKIVSEVTEEQINEEESKYEVEQKLRWTTIYRTPQFSEWYKEGYMDLGGSISGVQHFESVCTSYTGIEEEPDEDGEPVTKWSSQNDCALVPDDITVMNATDGKNSDNEMVLRFSAVITFDPAVFLFSNKYMLTIGPTGKTDVTDSYIQIENMFEERGEDWTEVR